MKCQDVLLVLKLYCLSKLASHERQLILEGQAIELLVDEQSMNNWEGWEPESEEAISTLDEHLYKIEERYAVRNLSAVTGISKSEVSNGLIRLKSVDLVTTHRVSNLLTVNTRALFEFLVYGLKYVFPAELGALGRGIPTSFAAPVMQGKLMSAGESIFVWPDPRGKEVGQIIQPLYKTVTFAVKLDSKLYALMALVDALRIGAPRERKVAMELLEKELVHG